MKSPRSSLCLGMFASMVTLAASTHAHAADEGVEREIHVTEAMLTPRFNNSLSPRRFVPGYADGTPLKGAKFYVAIGRQDLADTYRRRRRIFWGLWGGGAGLTVAGLGVAIAGSVQKPENKAMTFAGLGIATAGVFTVVAANIFSLAAPAHSVDASEVRQLINEHNAKVASKPRARVRVGPQLTLNSAGLSLAGRF